MELNMNLTLHPNSKWQPSVLHLLPFSPNDAGASSVNASLTTTNGAPTASYIQEEAKGFPALSISQQDRDKIRSKSAGVQNKMNPEKLPPTRPQTYSNVKGHTSSNRPRAKSNYGNSSDKKQLESIKFSINDINEQILGRTQPNVGEKLSPSPDSVGDVGEFKVKPLPKPAMRQREGRWPQTSARFWRSSCVSPGELELQRHKNNLDIYSSTTRKFRRVKLNVKDLPRSKTPISENDPDKLNIKHVIAFLQSNTPPKDERNDMDEVVDRKLTGDNFVSGDTRERIANKDRDSFLKSAESPQEITRFKKTTLPMKAANGNFSETRQGDSFPDKIQNTVTSSQSQPVEEPHIGLPMGHNSYDTVKSKSTVQAEKAQQSMQQSMQTVYYGKRSKSFDLPHEKTQFRLPANLRYIRESANELKPSRLHRFLSLVSNTASNTTPSMRSRAYKHNSTDNNSIASGYRSHSSLSRSLLRSSKNSKMDYKYDTSTRSQPKRSQSEARRYYLAGEGYGKVELTDKFRRRSKSQESHYQKDTLPHARSSASRNKVICLPVAPLDVDSDEDYNPLPTVPGRLDRKGVVLSAQGHAIIAQHFAPTPKFVRNGIRPHSVKDAFHRHEHRSELPSTSHLRPASMRNIKLEPMANEEDNGNPPSLAGTNDPETGPKSTDWGLNISSEAILGDDEIGTMESPLGSGQQPANPSSPSRSETDCHQAQDSSTLSAKSKTPEGIVTFLTEAKDLEDENVNAVSVPSITMTTNDTPNVDVNQGTRNKRSTSFSPPLHPGEPVKLTLRKERNLTRELTYMLDMGLTSGRNRDAGSGSSTFNT